jgi:hypothetical protein
MLKRFRRDVYLADMPDSDTEIEPKRYLTWKLSSKDIKILNNIYNNAKNIQKHLSMRKTKKIKKNHQKHKQKQQRKRM